MIDQRDNGDLVVIASNGDPLLKLQLEEPAVSVNELRGHNHPFDCRNEMLSREDVEAIRDWAEEALQP